MKICSVTIAPRRPDAEDAIATVTDLVDGTLVSIQEGPIRDFSQARNDSLAMAAEDFHYDWAIMLDTDERIHTNLPRSILEKQLSETAGDIIMIPHVSDTYEKERFFRLPARGHYVGPTHEAWITDDGAKRITWGRNYGYVFDELPKNPEQLTAKFERDKDILEAWTKDHPKDPRWWYYLGDNKANLGNWEDAVRAFRRCYDLDGWDEESAWSAYRIAEQWIGQGGPAQLEQAITWGLNGMRRRADFPEFPWLIGWCSYYLGRYQQAITWSEIAVNLGQYRKLEGELPTIKTWDRIGFRYPPAHYEAPFDVMRWAWGELGDTYAVSYAQAAFELALEMRTRKNPGADGAPGSAVSR